MSDDQGTLATELDRLAAQHARLAADAANLANRVRRLGRIGDALDDLRSGGLLTCQQAATSCDVTDQAIRDCIDHSIKLADRSPKSARPGSSARRACSLMSRSTAAASLSASKPRTCSNSIGRSGARRRSCALEA